MKGDSTFPQGCRLRTSQAYQLVWQSGRRHHTAHFIVIVSRGAGTHSRLGLTVSRKVGNAVCRNRLKRWIRELFRVRRSRLQPPVDISVIAKRQAGILSHAEVEHELSRVFAHLMSHEEF